MKKTIFVVVIAVMLTTPCIARELEPDGIFSLDGTLWSICYIGFGLAGFEFTPTIFCGALGYYQGVVYSCRQDYCSETWDMFYIDLGAVSITYTFGNGLYIMQPAIGLGVYSRINIEPGGCMVGFGCHPPAFVFLIGIMFKINDNWTPPAIE